MSFRQEKFLVFARARDTDLLFPLALHDRLILDLQRRARENHQQDTEYVRGEAVCHQIANVSLQLSEGVQEQILHRDDDSIGVGRRERLEELRVGQLEGDDGCSMDEQGFAAVRGEAVLDEVDEAAMGQCSQEGRRAGCLLSAELLEQALQLLGRRELDQALQQARARLAVCNLQLLPVGFLVHAVEE
jgi:hypothetical protein